MVEPNTQNLTGNFEFIHCADPGEFTGQRVRLSARVKAQGVKQTAHLRLRGEDLDRKRNLLTEFPVTGTYDWKDVSVEALVGPEVMIFSYGFTFKSSGKLWIAHPKFTVLGDERASGSR